MQIWFHTVKIYYGNRMHLFLHSPGPQFENSWITALFEANYTFLFILYFYFFRFKHYIISCSRSVLTYSNTERKSDQKPPYKNFYKHVGLNYLGLHILKASKYLQLPLAYFLKYVWLHFRSQMLCQNKDMCLENA